MRLSQFLTLSTLFTALLLTSCGTFSEEIWINTDGSGRYKMGYDASESLEMIPLMISLSTMASEEEQQNAPEMHKALMKGFAQSNFDTTFNIFQALPDSVQQIVRDRDAIRRALIADGEESTNAKIEEKLASYKLMEKMDISIHMDLEKSSLGLGMATNFLAPADISEIFGGVPDMKSLNAPGASRLSANDKSNRSTFKLDKNRVTILQLPPANMNDIVNATEGWINGMTAEEQQAYLDKSGLNNYTVKVHVPGTVESVRGAAFTKLNENTVLLEAGYLELLKAEKLMEVEISFQPTEQLRHVSPK